MQTLLIALLAGVGFLAAYHTYGRWLGGKIFALSRDAVCPSARLNDGVDYVPTPKAVVFGHHFTSIAGTGPIVGPAIAIMWGWLPALLWVVFGSIFIGAVHDLGSLVVSLRNQGQTVGDIAGRVINRRVRLLFLLVLFMALTIVLAIFGLVIASVFRLYPSAIFPCLIQIPIALGIGVWLHRKGVHLLLPSCLALATMYLTVVFGNDGWLGNLNQTLAGFSVWRWVVILLVYSYIASVLPVWMLLQPRDYINSLQLISALALMVLGLVTAAFIGGAPVEGVRPELVLSAPMVDFHPEGAPMVFPFLFITIACGAISGFHCLVSSGTSSKQLMNETDARFVGYGGMLTEGFLATLVILACAAGLGLGLQVGAEGPLLTGTEAWAAKYTSWKAAGSLGAKVGAFVDGAANFLKAMGISAGIAVALMGVLVASFAGTTLDTACRLQRYVVQELARTLNEEFSGPIARCSQGLRGKHAATLFAITIAALLAAAPNHTVMRVELTSGEVFKGSITSSSPSELGFTMENQERITIPMADIARQSPVRASWSWDNAGKGGLILWPLFGATNQLLGGLAFLVITFHLWRRGKPVWFVVLPMVFMLIMPFWALCVQLFTDWGAGASWLSGGNLLLIGIAVVTLALEIWMIVEAVRLFPTVRGVIENGARTSG